MFGKLLGGIFPRPGEQPPDRVGAAQEGEDGGGQEEDEGVQGGAGEDDQEGGEPANVVSETESGMDNTWHLFSPLLPQGTIVIGHHSVPHSVPRAP